MGFQFYGQVIYRHRYLNILLIHSPIYVQPNLFLGVVNSAAVNGDVLDKANNCVIWVKNISWDVSEK